jgi:NitT/TauT family transport system substrate-binding protein
MKPSPIALRPRRTRNFLLAALLMTIALLAASCSSSSTTPAPPSAKKLSMSSVTMVAGSSPSNALLFIALHQGFFKKLGLNVTWLNATTSASSATAIVVSGGAQFLLNDAPPTILAVQKGAALRAVFEAGTGVVQDIAINSTFAAAHHIPAVAKTEAAALKQFKALKGSHITLAVSNTGSQSYYDLVTLAKLYGLKMGPNGDFTVTTLGTPAALVAAINAGKVDGIVNAPPTTAQPNTISIPLYLIPPVTIAAGLPVATTTEMIKDHPDVVQAVVTGLTEAMYYVKSHPGQAEQDARETIEGAGVTPTSFQASYPSESGSFKTPLITKAAYAAELELVNDASPAPLTLSYSQFVVPTFFNKAVKQLGTS